MTQEEIKTTIATSRTPILLDFTAPWCGPCKRMKPIVEKLAKEYTGWLSLCEIDIQEMPEIAQKYHVLSVPTFVMLKDAEDKRPKMLMGSKTETQLKEFVEAYLQ